MFSTPNSTIELKVQRLLSLPNLRSAQTTLWVQVPILMVLSMTTSLAGLCIFYQYRDCDPLSSGRNLAINREPIWSNTRKDTVSRSTSSSLHHRQNGSYSRPCWTLCCRNIFWVFIHSVFGNKLISSCYTWRLLKTCIQDTWLQYNPHPEDTCSSVWHYLHRSCILSRCVGNRSSPGIPDNIWGCWRAFTWLIHPWCFVQVI